MFVPNDSLLLNVQQLGVDQDLGHSTTTTANKNDSSNSNESRLEQKQDSNSG
jgi:hypothetical protein